MRPITLTPCERNLMTALGHNYAHLPGWQHERWRLVWRMRAVVAWGYEWEFAEAAAWQCTRVELVATVASVAELLWHYGRFVREMVGGHVAVDDAAREALKAGRPGFFDSCRRN